MLTNFVACSHEFSIYASYCWLVTTQCKKTFSIPWAFTYCLLAYGGTTRVCWFILLLWPWPDDLVIWTQEFSDGSVHSHFLGQGFHKLWYDKQTNRRPRNHIQHSYVGGQIRESRNQAPLLKYCNVWIEYNGVARNFRQMEKLPPWQLRHWLNTAIKWVSE